MLFIPNAVTGGFAQFYGNQECPLQGHDHGFIEALSARILRCLILAVTN